MRPRRARRATGIATVGAAVLLLLTSTIVPSALAPPGPALPADTGRTLAILLPDGEVTVDLEPVPGLIPPPGSTLRDGLPAPPADVRLYRADLADGWLRWAETDAWGLGHAVRDGRSWHLVRDGAGTGAVALGPVDAGRALRLDHAPVMVRDRPAQPAGSGDDGAASRYGDGAALRVLDIVLDGDREFYEAGPGDWAERQLAIVNVVDGLLRHEAGIAVTVVLQHVHNESQPLSSRDAGTLLDQLRTHWNARPDVDRDLVHLFTGKDLAGSTAGIAYARGIGVVQTGGTAGDPAWAYALSMTTLGPTANWVIAAHEIGHSLNGAHERATCPTGDGVETGCDLMFPVYFRPLVAEHYGPVNELFMRRWAAGHLSAAGDGDGGGGDGGGGDDGGDGGTGARVCSPWASANASWDPDDGLRARVGVLTDVCRR